MKYEALQVIAVLAAAYVGFRLMYRAITGGWDKSDPKLEGAEPEPDAERDRILLLGTLDEQRDMLTKALGFPPSCDEVTLRAVNKAITGLAYLPKDRRDEAEAWLKAHNSEPWS